MGAEPENTESEIIKPENIDLLIKLLERHLLVGLPLDRRCFSALVMELRRSLLYQVNPSADAYIVRRGSRGLPPWQRMVKRDLGRVTGRLVGAKLGVLGHRWNLGGGLRAE